MLYRTNAMETANPASTRTGHSSIDRFAEDGLEDAEGDGEPEIELSDIAVGEVDDGVLLSVGLPLCVGPTVLVEFVPPAPDSPLKQESDAPFPTVNKSVLPPLPLPLSIWSSSYPATIMTRSCSRTSTVQYEESSKMLSGSGTVLLLLDPTGMANVGPPGMTAHIDSPSLTLGGQEIWRGSHWFKADGSM